MDIFSFKLNLVSDWIIKSRFYYSVLWWILNLFANDENIYNSILSISPVMEKFNWDGFFVKISVLWRENFDFIINKIFSSEKKISLDWKKFFVKWIDFDFKIFDLKRIKAKNFNSFEIIFLSPTFTKTTLQKKQITNILPSPDVFLFSVYNKFVKIYWDDKEEFNDFKKIIKDNIFISEINIKSKVNQVKKWVKSWIVWRVKYVVLDDFKYKNFLFCLLKFGEFVWIWSGVKLWFWSVKIKYF